MRICRGPLRDVSNEDSVLQWRRSLEMAGAGSFSGECYTLMKDVLVKNNIDGTFQQEVMSTLTVGRKKMRNLCLVGGPNSAKSFLFKPLAQIFKSYSRPDGGSYQLEDILDKEIVFLNDFEYDEDAKKWCPWQFFKRFLEGECLPVACPKNRGGNRTFESSAPVFITAPQEISYYRGRKRDAYETSQMEHRVKYIHLFHLILEASRRECESCAHCGARLYLEGSSGTSAADMQLETQSAGGVSAVKRNLSQTGASSSTDEHVSSKPRLSESVLGRLQEVHTLMQAGILDQTESKRLKDQIMADLASAKSSPDLPEFAKT